MAPPCKSPSAISYVEVLDLYFVDLWFFFFLFLTNLAHRVSSQLQQRKLLIIFRSHLVPHKDQTQSTRVLISRFTMALPKRIIKETERLMAEP
jgi:hypothetical protein